MIKTYLFKKKLYDIMHKVVQKSHFISMVWSLHCKALTSRPPASTMDSRWPGPVITHSNPFEKKHFCGSKRFHQFHDFFHRFGRLLSPPAQMCVPRRQPPAHQGCQWNIWPPALKLNPSRHLQKFHPATSAPVKSRRLATILWCFLSQLDLESLFQTAFTGFALGKYGSDHGSIGYGENM